MNRTIVPLLIFALGCTAPPLASRYVKTATVTAQGATLQVSDKDSTVLAGASLVVQAGSANPGTVITLELGMEDLVPHDKRAGPVTTWGPAGLLFSTPARMTVPVQPGLSLDALEIQVVERDGTKAVLPHSALTVDANQRLVSFDVTGFTSFQPILGAPVAACDATTCSDGCCFEGLCVTSAQDSAAACGRGVAAGAQCETCKLGNACGNTGCGNEAAQGCIIVSRETDFGSVEVGCAEERTVTVINRCPGTAHFNPSISGDSDYSFVGTVPAVSGNTSTPFTIRYAPSSSKRSLASFRISTNTSTYSSALFGRGVTGNVMVEEFDVPREIDLLVVVDNSGSMATHQAGVVALGDRLYARSADAGIDWRLGVSTADVADNGNLLGSPTFVTSATPNLNSVLMQRLDVGIAGDTVEGQFAGLIRAVIPPTSASHNESFLREKASLGVLLITDGEDGSPESVDTYGELLRAVKGHRRLNDIHLATLSPTLPSPPSMCSYENNDGFPYSRTRSLVDALGGMTGEICEMVSHPSSVVGPAATFNGQRTAWRLQGRPSSSMGISAWVDGVSIPNTQLTYDAARQTIRLQSPLTAGQRLRVNYSQTCRP